MATKKSTDSQAFWIDDPAISALPSPSYGKTLKLFSKFITYWFAFAAFIIVFIIPLVFFIKSSPLLAWLWVITFLIFLFFNYYGVWKIRQTRSKAILSQAKAKEITGASLIGSAIHVAGHPLLERNQAVVLGLVDDKLSIFNYTSPHPIDTIELIDLLSIHTVIYDDDRVPHIEVIDSAAQALQITFSREGQQLTCLFRQMLKIRPIDWYHAIEQARYRMRSPST